MNITVLVFALAGALVLGLGLGYVSGYRYSYAAVMKLSSKLDWLKTEQATKRKLELAMTGCLRCLRKFENLIGGL